MALGVKTGQKGCFPQPCPQLNATGRLVLGDAQANWPPPPAHQPWSPRYSKSGWYPCTGALSSEQESNTACNMLRTRE